MDKKRSKRNELDFYNNCPDVSNGGKEKCEGDNCSCADDGETVCIMGICVCMHQRHLAFHQINCNDQEHALILKNLSHHELECPETCLSSLEDNSCPPSSRKGEYGRCFCANGSRVIPNFTKDYTLDLPLDVCAHAPFLLDVNSTHDDFQTHVDGITNIPTARPSFVTSSIPLIYLIFPVLLIVLIIFSLIAVYMKCLSKASNQSLMSLCPIMKRQRDSDEPISNSQDNNQTENTKERLPQSPNEKVPIPSFMEDNPAYFSTSCLLKSKSESSKMFKDNFISNEKIKKGQRIGNGHFGEVYKGTYESPTGNQEVAIKIPKITWITCCSPCEVENLKSFFAEAEITLGFNHENVLSCLGITIGSIGEPWMIVEFMRYGDLANVLRTNSGVLSLQCSDSPILEMIDLLRISYQIALGMQYLTNQHFIHRDLAARNCLVGENLRVKISDFGLTRDIYSNEYYKLSGTEKLLPIRWMAPESITHGKFTHETDVWSFGVVLWEIFTFGKVPHYLRSNKEVMEAVSLGQHLEPPEGCPYLIKHLMLSCWQLCPTNRIRFSTIVDSLSEDNIDNSMGYSRILFFNDRRNKEFNETKNGLGAEKISPQLSISFDADSSSSNDPLVIEKIKTIDCEIEIIDKDNTVV